MQSESVIQSELVQRGPLSIAINALTLQFYHSGVWDPILPCSNKSLDHGKCEQQQSGVIHDVCLFVCDSRLVGWLW